MSQPVKPATPSTRQPNLSSFQELSKYYDLLSPQGVNKNYYFKGSLDSEVVKPEDKVFEAYFGQRPKSGADIIEELTPDNDDEGVDSISGYGSLFNTVYQDADDEEAEYLHRDYWSPSENVAGGLREEAPEDFYGSVIRGPITEGDIGTDSGPEVAFTINVFRGPALSEASKSASKVEMFLNYMPSYFPSMMTPYLDVEFQYPVDDPPYDGPFRTATSYRQPRPSLFRFLMGSDLPLKNAHGQQIFLTPSDIGISFPVRINPFKVGNDTRDYSYFSGMEMFTAPQTLTNMDTLNEGKGRLNDVKPFLPPASLINASIQMLNAGAGSFLHKKATVTLKVHDKARLVEFSEFLRSAQGYRDLTVWLTYGWLASRTDKNEEIDVYSKFINENMLVREAFMIKNNSFAFDATGQVEVKLELVSKGFKHVESATIDVSKPTDLINQTAELIKRIQNNKKYFGEVPAGVEPSEIRIYQVISAAVSGQKDIGIPGGELETLFSSAENAIFKKKMTQSDRQKALQLIDDLRKLYTKKPPAAAKQKEVTDLYSQTIEDIKSSNSKNFSKCRSLSSPDPFLPDGLKTVNDEPLFSQELIIAMNDSSGMSAEEYQANFKKGSPPPTATQTSNGAPKQAKPERDLVSFGKVFCVFCLPSLLRSAKLEGIDEVQVNFFQFNEQCGPMSLHNIAEFPISISDFQQQFADFVYRRGGDAVTVQEFMGFISQSQFTDPRAPGYGMRSYYEPYDIQKPQESKAESEVEFNNKMTNWIARWGGFKKPNIGIKMETVIEGGGMSAVDLLYHLQDDVGMINKSQINPNPDKKNPNEQRKIKKIVIYDKQFSPYSKLQQIVYDGIDGSPDSSGHFNIYNGVPTSQAEESVSEVFKDKSAANIKVALDQFKKSSNQVGETTSLNTGKNILKDFLKNSVPTLIPGTNGSLISNINLASKADGLLGTINMQGGSFRSKSTLAPNGLSMGEYSLPMRVVPASLTMNTLGCPIADVYQQYFIDFGTGTTIDNLYTCTQLSHNISQGKFESQWTFTYTDGYSKFFGAPSLKNILEKFVEQQKVEEAPAQGSAALGLNEG